MAGIVVDACTETRLEAHSNKCPGIMQSETWLRDRCDKLGCLSGNVCSYPAPDGLVADIVRCVRCSDVAVQHNMLHLEYPVL
jgi:hypothetical protein